MIEIIDLIFCHPKPKHSLLQSVLLSITVNRLMSRCLHSRIMWTSRDCRWMVRHERSLSSGVDSRWELIGQWPWCDWQPLQLQECDVACNALFPRWIRHVSSSTLLSQHHHAFTAVHMCSHYLLNLTVKLLAFKSRVELWQFFKTITVQ